MSDLKQGSTSGINRYGRWLSGLFAVVCVLDAVAMLFGFISGGIFHLSLPPHVSLQDYMALQRVLRLFPTPGDLPSSLYLLFLDQPLRTNEFSLAMMILTGAALALATAISVVVWSKWSRRLAFVIIATDVVVRFIYTGKMLIQKPQHFQYFHVSRLGILIDMVVLVLITFFLLLSLGRSPGKKTPTNVGGRGFVVAAVCMSISTVLNVMAMEALANIPGTQRPNESLGWGVVAAFALITSGIFISGTRFISLFLALVVALVELLLAWSYGPLALLILGASGGPVSLIPLSIPVHLVCIVASAWALIKASTSSSAIGQKAALPQGSSSRTS